MGLDIRIPIGGMFAIIGVILIAYGIATAGNTVMYQQSLGININLWWGVVMLVFGAIMLIMGRMASSRPASTPNPQEEAIEEREHKLGLEK